MAEPSWVTEARKHIGMKEVPGAGSNKWILSLWKPFFSWLGDDDSKVPWCGSFVGFCLRKQGYAVPKEFFRAKEWLNWGTPLKTPAVGCVVVLGREGGGHVFFATAKTADGKIVGIGGNQGDSVNVRSFDLSRVLGYRWPADVPMCKTELPVVAFAGTQSTAEA